jgi:hypothetical protein
MLLLSYLNKIARGITLFYYLLCILMNLCDSVEFIVTCLRLCDGCNIVLVWDW